MMEIGNERSFDLELGGGNDGSDVLDYWLTGMEEQLFSPVGSDISDFLDLKEDSKAEVELAKSSEAESRDEAPVVVVDSLETSKVWTRFEALQRYKLKRQNRKYGKKIRYECRKKIAAGRPRSGGRFVRVANK
ncbi:hypothetical protein NDN08_007909 [Rhodosorus marinus]|uniref:CCT domain-containing protein n=1 Tax=Rhodosorus marinus TaxID=101924 RepID=A0AAV8UYV9_9RHOD|nr:hypothetical protein NDN08_007909 [Rhodosorus marinus]